MLREEGGEHLADQLEVVHVVHVDANHMSGLRKSAQLGLSTLTFPSVPGWVGATLARKAPESCR